MQQPAAASQRTTEPSTHNVQLSTNTTHLPGEVKPRCRTGAKLQTAADVEEKLFLLPAPGSCVRPQLKQSKANELRVQQTPFLHKVSRTTSAGFSSCMWTVAASVCSNVNSIVK